VARELATNSAAQPRSVVAAGGLILEVLGIDGETTRQQLDDWVNGSNLTITTVRDPDGKYPQSQAALTTREWSYVIDLRTMKVVYKVFGSYGGGQDSVNAIDMAIADIINRLKSG
jgi:hypothetical protein